MNLDGTVHLVYDLFDDAQTQPPALHVLFVRVLQPAEVLEERVDFVLGHSIAEVLDGELKLDFVDGEASVRSRLEHFFLLHAAQVLMAEGVVFEN